MKDPNKRISKTQSTQSIRCLIVLGVFGAFITGCGKEEALTIRSIASLNAPNQQQTPQIILPPPPPSAGNPSPLIDFRAGAYGTTTQTITVMAGKKLKLKFTPGVQDQKVKVPGAPQAGYSPAYSQLAIQIKVGTKTVQTPFLYNGAFGGSAQSTSILDFSGQLKACLTNPDPLCRSQIQITVGNAWYDHDCINYGVNCYPTPYQPVHSAHPWNGKLIVETDDTEVLN